MISLRHYLLFEAFKDRKDMPQIASQHLNDYRNFLCANNINTDVENIDAKILVPSQEINQEKADSLKNSPNGLKKSIIVDHNYRIIDGHHRWKASLDLEKNVNIIKISAPWETIYRVTKKFNKVFYAK